ncbi:hypothetical protein IC619_005880 [Hazenella sp. IB182353]|uniref:hypothetical protein n=1 Tax=Polycladospora coralii TaxID=2771432 RepID=UPI001746965C|nr:hypothetical protein [Polycladospora coralii]MBS7530026.1 hypothetical protein [Polycladospora coralii]
MAQPHSLSVVQSGNELRMLTAQESQRLQPWKCQNIPLVPYYESEVIDLILLNEETDSL